MPKQDCSWNCWVTRFCPAKFPSLFPTKKNVWDTGANLIQPSFCFGFFRMDLRHKVCHSDPLLGCTRQLHSSLQSKWLQRYWPKVGPANLELELLRWVSRHWPRVTFRDWWNPGDDQIGSKAVSLLPRCCVNLLQLTGLALHCAIQRKKPQHGFVGFPWIF